MPKFPWEKLEKLKKPHKLAILFGTVVLLGVVFYFVLYSPMTAKIQEARDANDKLKAEIAKALVQVRQLPQLKARLADIRLEFQFASQFLPEKKEVDNLLRQISDNVSQSGLNVTLFQPNLAESIKDFYAEITFDMTVEGPYLNVANFFYRIGRLSRIVNISNIKMGTPKFEEGQVSLVTSCKGLTFRFLTQAEIEEQKKKTAAAAAQAKRLKPKAGGKEE